MLNQLRSMGDENRMFCSMDRLVLSQGACEQNAMGSRIGVREMWPITVVSPKMDVSNVVFPYGYCQSRQTEESRRDLQIQRGRRWQ